MTDTALLLNWTRSLIIAFVSQTLKATDWCVLTNARNIFEWDPCLEIAPANPFQLSPAPPGPVKPCRRITDTESVQFSGGVECCQVTRGSRAPPLSLGMSLCRALLSTWHWHCQENVAWVAPALLVFVTFSLPFKLSLSWPTSYLTFTFQFSAPSCQGRASECVGLICWLWLNHGSNSS